MDWNDVYWATIRERMRPDQDGESAMGMKHWHLFDIVARRRESAET
jgi:hypothetical protein